MADLTEHFTKQLHTEQNADGPAAREAAVVRKEEEDVALKRNEGKFQGAYDQTDLSTIGPSRDKYNYQTDHEEGNTFKTDDNGGIQLNNKNFKPETVNVGGFDMATGKKYQNKWEDADGDITKGAEMLKKEDFNTKAGPSYRNSYGLSEVAKGVLKEGGTYDEYKSSVKGPWSEDQIAMSYSAAHNTKSVMDDIGDAGQRYYDEMDGDPEKFEGPSYEVPEEGYTEETLAANPDWISGGRELLFHMGGADVDSLSDEQVDASMKSAITLFRHNLPMMMMMANMAGNDSTGKMARALLAGDEMYDALDNSMDTSKRMIGAIAGDAFNWITIGGGILVTQLGKGAAKEGIKHSLKRLMRGVGFDAVVGAGFGAEFENERQNVEMAAGEREEKDIGMIGAMAALEGTANVIIGGPLNVITDKNLRGFAGKNMKEGYAFIRKMMDDLMPVPQKELPMFLRKQEGLVPGEIVNPSITGEMFTKKQAYGVGGAGVAVKEQERDEKGRYKKNDQ